MINLQNPSILIQVDPVEIDRVIIDLQTVLSNSLPWLTQPYGRAYKNLDISNGTRFYYPQVYLGKDKLQPKYLTVTPDNDKQGQCFFLVERETLTEQQQGQYGFLNYNLSIIFSVNLNLINSSLLDTDLFTANLIKEVRQVLRVNFGKEYQLKITTVDYIIDRVFAGLNVETQVIEKAPLQHFRVNTTVLLSEDCSDLPYNACDVLLGNLTEDQKNNCILPTYDFSNAVVQSATTGQQQVDLTNWLCTAPAIDQKTLSFDGVNGFVRAPLNSVYEIERTDSFTWSIWAKLGTLTGTSCLISKGDSTRGIAFNVTANGAIRVLLSNQGAFNGLAVTTLDGVAVFNEWHLYSFTYSGGSLPSDLSISFDAVPQTITSQYSTLTASILSVNKFRLGSQYGFALPVAPSLGRLFEFRQWNSVKTTAFLLQEYNEKGLTPSSDTPVSSCAIGTNAVYGEDGFCLPDTGGNGRLDGFSSTGILAASKTNDVPS
jgi:hypothetical protein